MRLFLISAELHGVHTQEDFAQFCSGLAARDIVRHVRGNDGLDHDLPRGTFAFTGTLDAAELVSVAFEVAETLQFTASIIAIPVGDEGWASSNLRRTRP